MNRYAKETKKKLAGLSRRFARSIGALFVLGALVFAGCSSKTENISLNTGSLKGSSEQSQSVQTASSKEESRSTESRKKLEESSQQIESMKNEAEQTPNPAGTDFTAADIPAYSGSASVEINGNVPFFEEGETSNTAFQHYFDLDALGRVTLGYASLGPELQPEEERGEISYRPTGFENEQYDCVEGGWVYNRCHLVAWRLSGQNDNPKNLMTGTRYMNIEGMSPYEEKADLYIEQTGNHVMYRVTPIFNGDDLVAQGVLMEAKSVEDDGAGLQYCVFCYNVQPGVAIDYASGQTQANGSSAPETPASQSPAPDRAQPLPAAGQDEEYEAPSTQITYVLNTHTGKFHRPGCSSVKDMAAHNRQDVTLSREEVLAQGYVPCKRCNP